MSAKKLDIPEKDIAIHFLLLKRDHKTPIEVIDVTSGAKAQENANKWLVKMANKIKKGRKLKQKPGPCAFCEFANTELCP